MTFFSDLGQYLSQNHALIWSLLREHIWLALLPVVLAFVVSLPISWAVVRFNWVRHPVLMMSSIVYTIPSLALFLLLPTVLGTRILDATNVVVALTLYSAALLVRTTADGLAAVDPTVLDAARAVGYGDGRRWFSITFPLSLPVVLAGVRVAAVANVSMVSMAALIGMGGLGQLFTRGFQLGFYLPPIVIGLVLSAALALVVDLVIVAAQRFLTPWTRAEVAR